MIYLRRASPAAHHFSSRFLHFVVVVHEIGGRHARAACPFGVAWKLLGQAISTGTIPATWMIGSLDDWTIEWLDVDDDDYYYYYDDDDDGPWPLHGYYRCFCITSISRLTPLQQQRIQVHVARFDTWMLRNRCGIVRAWDLIFEYLRSSNLHRSI